MSASAPRRGRRPAGGPDTRETILTAARELFADLGFERTTMRGVAARAGVDPSLIHHYFTDKDGLLAAALTLPLDPATLFAGLKDDPERAGAELVRRLLDVWETNPGARERMVGLLRASLSHERAAGVFRDLLGATVLAGLAEIVTPDRPRLRAALVGTQLGGLMLGRYVLRVPGVADASREQLAPAVGAAVQQYLTGSLGADGERAAL